MASSYLVNANAIFSVLGFLLFLSLFGVVVYYSIFKRKPLFIIDHKGVIYKNIYVVFWGEVISFRITKYNKQKQLLFDVSTHKSISNLNKRFGYSENDIGYTSNLEEFACAEEQRIGSRLIVAIPVAMANIKNTALLKLVGDKIANNRSKPERP